jgi:hypothetical protein
VVSDARTRSGFYDLSFDSARRSLEFWKSERARHRWSWGAEARALEARELEAQLALDAGGTRQGHLREALRRFEQAAMLGDSEGAWNAGWRYWLGEGTPRDPARALSWWRIAASAGHLRAKRELERHPEPHL